MEYSKGQDPKLETTGKYDQTADPALIALSPTAEVVVVATSNNLAFYDAFSGILDYTVTNIYSGMLKTSTNLKVFVGTFYR